jgi:hypothetical protein
VSGPNKAGAPAAACKRSVGAQRAARPAKAGLEEPIVGLSSRDASAAGPAAREGLAAKRARREMAPQGLENVQFAPENGMAPADLDHNIRCRRPPRASPRRTTAASRRMAESTSGGRGAHVSAGPPKVAESCSIWCLRF